MRMDRQADGWVELNIQADNTLNLNNTAREKKRDHKRFTETSQPKPLKPSPWQPDHHTSVWKLMTVSNIKQISKLYLAQKKIYFLTCFSKADTTWSEKMETN